jgi:hypothetical protein
MRVHQIASVTGHKRLALVHPYTEAAGREALERSAMETLIARPNGSKMVTNLEGNLANSIDKPMKGQG